MKAIQFLGGNKVAVVERPMPHAAGDRVVVRVTSSGICGTDLEVLLNQEHPLEVIAGHEATGVVHAVDAPGRFKAGDRVIVNCHITCNECEHCKNGDLIFCPSLEALGFDRDGGNAEYMLVPEASLRPLPDDIDEELGVIIGDALGTPFRGVQRAEIREGDWVGVFGVGPLGQMAVLCATQYTKNIIAVDLSDARLASAATFGASHLVNPSKQDALSLIREITGGAGLDESIDCSGNSQSIELALRALKLRGRHVQVGVCPDLRLNTQAQIIDKELTIVGSRNFNNNDLEQVEEFVRHNPHIHRIITHRFGLDEAQKAFDTARSREGIKILIKP